MKKTQFHSKRSEQSVVFDSPAQYHAVSLSGGKDSTCMLLMMIEKQMPIDVVLFADTGMEFPEMYGHLEQLEKHLQRERGLSITKEEVRAELAAKSAAGYGVQVRALLKRYGAAQLSAVNPDDYEDLLLEAQTIGTEGGSSAPTKPDDSRRLPQGCTQRRKAVMGEAEVGADD